ncbi:Dual specificity protein phosphatase 7 [Phytophthora nicotianae]|uniref:Dual specificity protein phosphatase 7 n=2 Tax=Phytophthora nicotianae TaxID=4792 RepID=A0A0W8CWA6_PHYNI|nr:Dual specificity protein phosphatase 7 [Phytophthora nicotianae]KUF88435.1 hypothetical protein AM588_10002336 [Phytophthora nicotianae]
MGNGQSRDGFEGVLPSESGVKATGTANPESPTISDAWTATTTDSSAVVDPDAEVPPVFVGKIVPPGHALQQEEDTSRLRLEASDVARAFNNTDRVDDPFVIPESVRKSRTLDAYADVCSEILPGFLFVSNFRVAWDTAKLRALGITHVINCCGELKQYEDGVEKPEIPAFNTLRLLLRDDANEDLTPFFPQVMEYIATSRQRSENGTKEKVLVHCHQGVSRSCAIAIAYVMLEQQLSYRDAAAMVKRQRAISSPNAAFICQLLEWEKDLQAMRTCENETTSLTLGGLYRLTPHANYDPECLVLKRCYEPSTGSARQRQNMANVKTPDDEQRLLWSHGTFVFQSPTTATDLIVWKGSECEISEAMPRAKELAHQLLRLQELVQHSDATMQMRIVEVQDHAGSGIDHFGYTTELQWSRESVSKMPLLLPTNEDAGISTTNGTSADKLEERATDAESVPQLFILETIGEYSDDSWDQLTNYDSEDLTSDSAFLLCSIRSEGVAEAYVWIGTSCNYTPDMIIQASQKHIQILLKRDSSPSLIVEHQNQESDEFWELFEAGY